MEQFYSPARIDGVVLDPFMGSGTTIGETIKLGGRAIGRDINPVSYFQVRTALDLPDRGALIRTFREIEYDVANAIGEYYKTILPNGTECTVLYYFWVMQTLCPGCQSQVDLFSTYVFARHAYAREHPTVKIVCPCCRAVLSQNQVTEELICEACGHIFNPTTGPVKGKWATCPTCSDRFSIAESIRSSSGLPSYRMYAKLIATASGEKQYQPITEADEQLFRRASDDLLSAHHPIPEGMIETGHNTDQVLNYGFRNWSQMFNSRQLLCLSMLADRIAKIDDIALRYAFTCLFSGALEFNNMFASYKGEGTGAVRHMFYHHILKPERTPLEANPWGTPKSSGAFSTLFKRRLLRAVDYCDSPFELALAAANSGRSTAKIHGLSIPIKSNGNADSYSAFLSGETTFLSCGDSANIDVPDGSVDVVVTDPPFFDNVHYSELADFFYVWQKMVFGDTPEFLSATTRSPSEVQNSDAHEFTMRLSSVFSECNRVLRSDGILAFTYHHSRLEGWRSILNAVVNAGFRVEQCHPVKAEMSVATPKHQAKEPIDFDIIMVCRKRSSGEVKATTVNDLELPGAIEAASAQLARLRNSGWRLSRNDVVIIVTAQIVSQISRRTSGLNAEALFQQVEGSIMPVIELLYMDDSQGADLELQAILANCCHPTHEGGSQEAIL